MNFSINQALYVLKSVICVHLKGAVQISWKNVVFVLIIYWKSVRKPNYLYWKSVFCFVFMLVVEYAGNILPIDVIRATLPECKV